MKEIPYISLFSGGMGLDLGLEKAGFSPVFCNDNDPAVVATIRSNRPKIALSGEDVRELTAKKIQTISKFKTSEIPFVAGGPPCQAFSVFGQRRGVLDARGKLIFEFQRLVAETRPHVFLMENVRGLLSMSILPKSEKSRAKNEDPLKFQHGSLLKKIFKDFEKIGYRVDCFVVNAANYGAPQIRERLILIGNRHNIVANFSEPLRSNRKEDRLPPFMTLGEVIGPKSGFKDHDPDLMNFSERKLKYLSLVPPGGNWRSLPVDLQKESMGKSWYLKGGRSAYWRKLSFDFPCPTLVTMPNHAGTSMCHPTELRALTVGEMAAVQGFPKSWKFAGRATEKCRLIGNAVPVKLGEIAGRAVREVLEKISRQKKNTKELQSSRIVHIRPHVRTRSFWKNGKALAGSFCYYAEETSSRPELSRI